MRVVARRATRATKSRYQTVAIPSSAGRNRRAHWVELAEAVVTAARARRAVAIDTNNVDAHTMRSAVGQQLKRRGWRLRSRRIGERYVIWAVRDNVKRWTPTISSVQA